MLCPTAGKANQTARRAGVRNLMKRSENTRALREVLWAFLREAQVWKAELWVALELSEKFQ
jgi:hypothetical protein